MLRYSVAVVCFVIFPAGSSGWRMAGLAFHFRTSPMTSRSSSCRPCTEHWIRAKLAFSKVLLERCVCTHAKEIWYFVKPAGFFFFTCTVCPTLQGKSLSLICGALSWLTDYEERRKQEAAALLQEEAALSTSTTQSSTNSSSAEPDWITDFIQKKAERDLVSKLKVQLH